MNGFEPTSAQRRRITDLEDRSFTAAILETLSDSSLDDDRRGDLGRLLNLLDDPRAIAPMTATLERSSAPEAQRETARSFLASGGHTIDSVTLRDWVGKGDDFLAQAALSLCDRAERDLLAVAVVDKRASVRKRALQAMSFGFEEPHWQRIHVSALMDPDPSVRACAADLLLWHEPLIAEQQLLVAAEDADDDVAVSALDSLRYYCSLRSGRSLFSHARDAATLRRQVQARESLEDLTQGFREHLDHHGVWFEEARAFLSDYDRAQLLVLQEAPTLSPSNGDLDPAFVRAAANLHRIRSQKNAVLDEIAVVKELGEADGQWAITMAMLQGGDPMSVSTDRRLSFGELLAFHSDPQVRMTGAKYLAAYEQTELLLQLLDDPNIGVRKSAAYSLHDVAPSEAVAAGVIAPVIEGDVGSTRAYESVRTWARHRSITSPDRFLDELTAFTFDERESVRSEAIEQLVSRNITSVGERMIELLENPPLMTWSIHTSIRSGRHHLGLGDEETKAAMRAWKEEDNLWLQVALAE